ncbi:MAG: Circadian clock protein kinase KaiC [Candidatus Heimdallarchaeota archaeon LC_2]|nr:MAG: Circadian clock protein kinase KaiC [Candidatus Heimdallarchaeota archaeon LC_2]
MQINRVSSGIPSIDHITDGGFPTGSVISYFGETGSGKTFASLKFLQVGLKNKDTTLMITAHHNIPSLKTLGKLINLDLEPITWVDAANWRTKRIDRTSASYSKYEVSDLTDLNALLAMIIQAYKDNTDITRIVFDSLSNLLMYSTPGVEQVIRFFELLIAFTRKNQITFIFTIEKNLHLESTISGLHFLSDGVIEFKHDSSNGSRLVKAIFVQYTNSTNSFLEW